FTLVSNTGLSLLFLHGTDLGHSGLALAYSITTLLNLGLYLVILRRRLGRIEGGLILRGLAGSLLASGIMGLLVWAFHRELAPHLDLATMSGRLIETLAPVAAGAAVYGLVSLVLQKDETRALLGLLKARRGARGAEPGGS
ncbi:MAG TPA: polysaccharide biosynthesis C-terminal domain-containing protein, partial [Limnochorda sp.]